MKVVPGGNAVQKKRGYNPLKNKKIKNLEVRQKKIGGQHKTTSKCIAFYVNNYF